MRQMRKGRSPKPAPKAAPAPARAPTYDDLLAIARLVESGSRFSEFRLRSGDIEVEVKRANGTFVAPAQAGAQPPEAGPPIAAAPAASRATVDLPPGAEIVRSPMVGTFYRSPEPGAPPFVEVGAKVDADTVVCIIEVMKLMNSITAGVSGVVTHVLVENAHPVEPGQPLVAIRPGR